MTVFALGADAAGLAAAVDAGDGSAFGPWTDAIEEAGAPALAQALRVAAAAGYAPFRPEAERFAAWSDPWLSFACPGLAGPMSARLMPALFARLRGGCPLTGGMRLYNQRSRAWLALAAALSE
jgi:hypothetical protein